MTSPILISRLPLISEVAFFLPPLEMKMKPIVFPPFNIHARAFSRQAPEPLVGPRKIKDDSSLVYAPAVETCQVEPPTMASLSTQVNNYTPAVHHFPQNAVYRHGTPSPSEYRTTLGDVSPILVPVNPIDILDADPIDEQDVTPRNPYLVAETNTPEWVDEQDVTPSTPHFATNTPEWVGEQDVTPSTSHLAVAEINTPDWVDGHTPFHQEFFDLEVDLIDLRSPNPESSIFDKDDSVLRAFGVSGVEDLDWVLEGFRATSVADTCIEAMSLPPLPNFSPVSSYDWAVSEAGPDLISFDSPYGTVFTIIFALILLSFPP